MGSEFGPSLVPERLATAQRNGGEASVRDSDRSWGLVVSKGTVRFRAREREVVQTAAEEDCDGDGAGRPNTSRCVRIPRINRQAEEGAQAEHKNSLRTSVTAANNENATNTTDCQRRPERSQFSVAVNFLSSSRASGSRGEMVTVSFANAIASVFLFSFCKV